MSCPQSTLIMPEVYIMMTSKARSEREMGPCLTSMLFNFVISGQDTNCKPSNTNIIKMFQHQQRCQKFSACSHDVSSCHQHCENAQSIFWTRSPTGRMVRPLKVNCDLRCSEYDPLLSFMWENGPLLMADHLFRTGHCIFKEHKNGRIVTKKCSHRNFIIINYHDREKASKEYL